MTKILHWFQRNYSEIYKTLLVFVSILLLVQLFPRQPAVDFEYQRARPWLYEDLIAPFNFAVLKSPGEIEREKEEIKEDFRPFFSRRPVVRASMKEEFDQSLEEAWEEKYLGTREAFKETNREAGRDILSHLYDHGIVYLDEEFRDRGEDFKIRLRENNIATEMQLGDLYTIQEAFLYAINTLEGMEGQVDTDLLKPLLESTLSHNVFYDDELTSRALNAELERISQTRGMVQEGEKIISRGELITDETYQILESFRAEYKEQVGDSSVLAVLYAGQFLLVSISMIVLLLFLYFFRRDVFIDNRRVLLILLSVLLMVFLTSLVIRYNVDYLYLVPVVMVPVIIRAFFDNRLALYVHITTIIMIGFLIPRSFEFVFLQFLAGIIAILSMASLRRRSQLFVTVILIFLTYSAVYFGLSLAHTGSF